MRLLNGEGAVGTMTRRKRGRKVKFSPPRLPCRRRHRPRRLATFRSDLANERLARRAERPARTAHVEVERPRRYPIRVKPPPRKAAAPFRGTSRRAQAARAIRRRLRSMAPAPPKPMII